MQTTSEALAEAAQQEPDLASYYDLHRTLLELQEEAKREITATLEMADENALRERLLHGQPLISFDQLPIKVKRFAELAREIAQAFVDYDVDIADRVLPTEEEWIVLTREQFEAGQALQEQEQTEGQQPDMTLAQMAAAQALRPYLQWAAEHALPHVDQDYWKWGYCPICGGAPDMATLDENAGARHLVCSRCNSQWLYRRVGCPFCGITDHTKVVYYPSEDMVYRLYVCHGCQRYLKTIDLREAKHVILLPAERVTTVAMDAAAQQEGYHS